MTGMGPPSQRPQDDAARGSDGPAPGSDAAAPATPVPSPAVERANRMSAANMLRSLLPLVVICLLLVGWQSLQEDADKGVRVVDPSNAIQLAVARASYAVPAPSGLGEDYRPTSARTDAGDADEGDPVTLEIGYLTPSQEFAGFVVSDDDRAAPLRKVLDDAVDAGTVDIGGETWDRRTTERGETALVRETEGVTVVVSGSASEEELAAVAEAVRPQG